jgi:hypothetical protein
MTKNVFSRSHSQQPGSCFFSSACYFLILFSIHWNQADNFFLAITDDYDYTEDKDLKFNDNIEESYILDAKYKAVSPHEVTEVQKHLSGTEKRKLEDVLAKHPDLFDGKLGLYPHEQVHLEVDPTIPPVHSRPYAVLHSQEETFKKELQRLLDVGVLRPFGPTERGSPTYIIPKKDGRVRWISDL